MGSYPTNITCSDGNSTLQSPHFYITYGQAAQPPKETVQPPSKQPAPEPGQPLYLTQS
jgi:hypothetical protein